MRDLALPCCNESSKKINTIIGDNTKNIRHDWPGKILNYQYMDLLHVTVYNYDGYPWNVFCCSVDKTTDRSHTLAMGNSLRPTENQVNLIYYSNPTGQKSTQY